jgi:hypothetical protein
MAHQDRHRQWIEAALQCSRRPRVPDGVHAVLPAVLGERACARRSDDTDSPSWVVPGPMAAGSAFMLPHLVRC